MNETLSGAINIENEVVEPAAPLAGSIDLKGERVDGEFGRMPWRPVDWSLLQLARFYGTHKIPFFDRDKRDDVIGPVTPNERRLVRSLTKNVWAGRKFSLVEMAQLMDGHPVEVVGKENLPKDTTFVVYGNHINNFFFRSLGVQIAQDQLIYKATGRHTTYLMGHGSANPVINSGMMRVKPLYEQMGETAGQIVVNREYVRNKGKAADKKTVPPIIRAIQQWFPVDSSDQKSLSQVARAIEQLFLAKSGNKKSSKQIIRAISRTLSEGDVLGIYPEEDDHRRMQRAKENAGGLFKFLARKKDVLFVPIGATAHGTDLRLIIGEPFKLERHTQMSDRQIIDRAMRRVALLLPEWQRGYYKEANRR